MNPQLPNPMKPRSEILCSLIIAAALVAGTTPAPAQSSELEQLKASMQQMQRNMTEMQKKINQLEREKATVITNALGQPTGSALVIQKMTTGGEIGKETLVITRHNLNDYQEGPRPRDQSLDPKYQGFFPVPNTDALIKFNAKPRVDVTSDTRNSGNPDRFVPAQIPVRGESGFGGSERFNVNARGSSLSVDVRAPQMPGDFRFYYNNDFFGSGSGMSYRLKQLYGQLYNFTAGFTYSCFEDPDAWPDTVDFEGPNSVIFARRALLRYMIPMSDAFQLNVGVEAPGAEIDGNSTTNSFNSANRAPDVTANVRWENKDVGHVQLGGVVRNIGVHGGAGVGNQDVYGWGVNLATSINVFGKDSLQGQVTVGEGIFRYMNDDFINNDAAFDSSGDLKAIPVFGVMGAYTHKWSDAFRSTVSYGYVKLDNEDSQGPSAYHITHYASANIIWQLRKHLSVGLEGLYGKKEVQSGATGDVWRVQLGMVYSLFD
jgi:DcaP outer membrane protein